MYASRCNNRRGWSSLIHLQGLSSGRARQESPEPYDLHRGFCHLSYYVSSRMIFSYPQASNGNIHSLHLSLHYLTVSFLCVSAMILIFNLMTQVWVQRRLLVFTMVKNNSASGRNRLVRDSRLDNSENQKHM